jgi:hypothetical protein
VAKKVNYDESWEQVDADEDQKVQNKDKDMLKINKRGSKVSLLVNLITVSTN